MTLKNVTTEPVAITWDGITYTWQPAEEKTLVYGVGLHCRDNRQSQLEVVAESVGLAPDTVRVEVSLVNPGPDELTVRWDNMPYTFRPNEPVVVDQALAHPLTVAARQVIAREDLKASLDYFAPPTDKLAAAEPAAEAPAKPKRTRKPKRAAAAE